MVRFLTPPKAVLLMENPSRPWQEIARDLAQETDRTRIAQLSEELNLALDEQVPASRSASLQKKAS
jgi:hypothetical protein